MYSVSPRNDEYTKIIKFSLKIVLLIYVFHLLNWYGFNHRALNYQKSRLMSCLLIYDTA